MSSISTAENSEKEQLVNQDADTLSLSVCMPGDTQCLREVSRNTTAEWTIKLADILDKTPKYLHLEQAVGEDCARLFLEKSIFYQIDSAVRGYTRRMAIKAAGGLQWKKPLLIDNPDLHDLLLMIWPQSEIPLMLKRNRIKCWIKVLINTIHRHLVVAPREIRGDISSPGVGMEVMDGLGGEGFRHELVWWDGALPKPESLFCLSILNRLPRGQLIAIQDLKKRGVDLFSSAKAPIELGENYNPEIIKLLQYPRLIKFLRFCLSSKYQKKMGLTPLGSYLPLLRVPRFYPSAKPLAAGSFNWLDRRVDVWLAGVEWWADFFKKNRIKVWIFCNEDGVETIAQRAAMDWAGGITLHRQRSEGSGYPDSLGESPAHISLVWSEIGVDKQRTQRNRNELVVPVGHCYGASSQIDYPQSNRYRLILEKEGVRFVMVFFDNPCTVLHDTSAAQMCELYRRLMGLVIENPDMGLLVKSKNRKTEKAIQKEIPDLWDEALRTKRMHVCNEYNILPIVLSKASELTIGVRTSSAALESSIAGLRTFYYYPASAGAHILEKKAMGQKVFRSADKMVQAIQSIYAGAGGNLGLADKNLAKSLDAYGDGKGPQRIRQLINYLLASDLSDRPKVYQELKNKVISAWI
jgi:hypothetical protein